MGCKAMGACWISCSLSSNRAQNKRGRNFCLFYFASSRLLFLDKRLAIRALIDRRICFVGSYANAVQRAIAVVFAVICAARYIAFNAIVRGAFLLIHCCYLLSKFNHRMAFFKEKYSISTAQYLHKYFYMPGATERRYSHLR